MLEFHGFKHWTFEVCGFKFRMLEFNGFELEYLKLMD
jgi:hypothetical protein